jgi:hypothetical protein
MPTCVVVPRDYSGRPDRERRRMPLSSRGVPHVTAP